MVLEHALERARERYGIELTSVEYLALCTRLAAREGLLVADQGEGREVWCIPFNGRWLVAVFDQRPARIVTFLPPSRRPMHDYGSKLRRAAIL